MRLRHIPARTIAVAAAMVGLLAIASLATRGGGSTSAPPGSAIAGVVGQHLLVVAALVAAPIVFVVGGGLFIYAQIFRRQADPTLMKRWRRSRRGTLVLLVLIAGLLIYRFRTGRNPLAFLHLRNPLRNLTAAGHAKLGRSPIHSSGKGGVSTTDWTLAALLWIVLIAAVAYLLWRWRIVHAERQLRLRMPVQEEEPTGPDLESLRAERNPRRAVIAAYAAMEGLMARDGLARGGHEAPMEYLGRVTLHGHDRVGSVHRLTGLFQRARFSHRPVDEDMRLRAIAAVDELAQPPDDADEPA